MRPMQKVGVKGYGEGGFRQGEAVSWAAEASPVLPRVSFPLLLLEWTPPPPAESGAGERG